ncbi:hypothetical protein [Rhizobium sp. RM]|uniref:hypothetical protein n=1 Tax=Rhizobium sp. RM TaxID=2748079 RepID=UPI00110F198C|nr:hypothetical protein [Rhizobium sp. RM]NWJ25894.1 hypothetical protein [Rhizobium sp. RM]TMV15824.1 hypothetical protein BJG94_22105 [Rhizobium sp. Td3]
MHIVVSWDVADGIDRDAIVDALLAVIQPYQWVRPLTTLYITRANFAERNLIIGGMQQVALAHPGRVNVVVSPVMEGRYDGALDQTSWQQINDVTG